jgi:hypothetical protein
MDLRWHLKRSSNMPPTDDPSQSATSSLLPLPALKSGSRGAGLATTEFWVHTVIQSLIMIQTSIHSISPTVGATIAAVLAGIYIVARAIVKFGDSVGLGMNTAVPADPETPTPTAGVVGKITPSLMILVTLLGLACGFNGCAQSETNRVGQSIVATTAQAKFAKALQDARVTTPAQELHIAALLDAQRDAEDAYYTAIRVGDADALKQAKAAWAAATSATADELAKYKLPPSPTTRPAIQPATQPAKHIIPEAE